MAFKNKGLATVAAKAAAKERGISFADVQIVAVAGGYDFTMPEPTEDDLEQDGQETSETTEEVIPEQYNAHCRDHEAGEALRLADERDNATSDDNAAGDKTDGETTSDDAGNDDGAAGGDDEPGDDVPDNVLTGMDGRPIRPWMVRGRKYALCIAVEMPSDACNPLTYARELVAKLKQPVHLVDGETHERLEVIEYVSASARRAAAKAEGGQRTPRERTPRERPERPTGREATVIRMAMRPDGVTREQLKVVSQKQQPWTAIIKKAAERWGLEYGSTVNPDRTTTYFLKGEIDLGE